MRYIAILYINLLASGMVHAFHVVYRCTHRSNDGILRNNDDDDETQIMGDSDNHTPNVHKMKANIPMTPCNRICRYNSSFYNGQVCIGCYRETYEIEMWQTQTPMQKAMTLLDAIDRSNNNEDEFEGAVTVEDLTRQYEYWSSV